METSTSFSSIGKEISRLVSKRQQLAHQIDIVKAELNPPRLRDLLALANAPHPSLDFLDRDEDDSPSYFKERIELLVLKIADNAERFKCLPKGPLYKCLKVVRGEEWLPIVEKILYPYLFTFITDNEEDAKALREIISTFFTKKDNVNVDVIPFSYVDNERNKLGTYNYSLPSLLKAEHDSWNGWLYMKIWADAIYLFHTEHEARVFIQICTGVDGAPGRVKKAYSLDGRLILHYSLHSSDAFSIPKKAYYIEKDDTRERLALSNQLMQLQGKYDNYTLRIDRLREMQLYRLPQ